MSPSQHVGFERGDQIVWRSWPQGQIGTVIPLTVVEDSIDAIAVFQHDDSTCLRRTGERGGPSGRCMVSWDGGYTSVSWKSAVMRVREPGTHYTVMRWWHPEHHDYAGWYVNLDLDWVRNSIGFDSLDLALDVVADDDLENVRLKDDDELAWAEEHGSLTHQQAAIARAEAERVTELIATRSGLFGADWSRWQPEPDWPIPILPENGIADT